MTDCDSCPRCHDAPETVMHSIHDCEEILDYWRIFVHQDHWAKFCSLGLVGWLKWHLLTPNIGNFDVYWPTFFGLSIYALWNDRNILVFSSRSHLHTGLVEAVQSQLSFTLTQLSAPTPSYVDTSRNEWHIARSPPPEHTVKVNVDGSRRGTSSLAACGGLLRSRPPWEIHQRLSL